MTISGRYASDLETLNFLVCWHNLSSTKQKASVESSLLQWGLGYGRGVGTGRGAAWAGMGRGGREL